LGWADCAAISGEAGDRGVLQAVSSKLAEINAANR
jgi:hypothetical protein